MKPFNQHGFTLVEVLLSVIMIAFLGTVVFAVFSQGIKIWHRTMLRDIRFEAGIMFEKMSSDLKNMVQSDNKVFTGDRTSCSFLSLSTSAAKVSNGKNGLTQLYEVRYVSSDGGSKLLREESAYESFLSTSHNRPDRTTELLSNVRQVSFEYFINESTDGVSGWRGTWHIKCIPEAIKVAVRYDDQNSSQVLSRVLRVPLGGCKLLEKEEKIDATTS